MRFLIDGDFAAVIAAHGHVAVDVRDPPAAYPGIVVFETADSSIDAMVGALEHLPGRADVAAALPGRLAIVTAARIRLHPPL